MTHDIFILLVHFHVALSTKRFGSRPRAWHSQSGSEIKCWVSAKWCNPVQEGQGDGDSEIKLDNQIRIDHKIHPPTFPGGGTLRIQGRGTPICHQSNVESECNVQETILDHSHMSQDHSIAMAVSDVLVHPQHHTCDICPCHMGICIQVIPIKLESE